MPNSLQYGDTGEVLNLFGTGKCNCVTVSKDLSFSNMTVKMCSTRWAEERKKLICYLLHKIFYKEREKKIFFYLSN
jgi:hypothetical protein